MKTFSCSLLWMVSALCILQHVYGFGISSTQFGVRRSRTLLYAEDMGGRYYQLQEMEDKESSDTEIFLNADGTVTVGESDGPAFQDANGAWSLNADGDFVMTITRRFEAGREKQAPTDIGQFEFMVERSYSGELTKVGAKLSVTGVMHDIDQVLGDKKVGFFTIIDTSEERENQEKAARVQSTSN